MPNYYAGHDYFLQAMADAGALTESYNSTPAAIAALSWSTSAGLVGYTGPSQIVSSEGTKKGYSGGYRGASYDGKGARTNQLSADIKVGSSDFISTYCLAATPPYLALRWGVDNQWANVLRKAVCDSVTLNFTEGGAQEIEAQAQFQAMARQDGATVLNTSYTREQFGAVLFWHNVMSFTIGGTQYRDAIAGLSVTLANNIEYKGQRPDWGDDNILSRTAYGLMVHHKVVTGSIQFHDYAAAALFSAAADSSNWGDLVLTCSDASAGGVPKVFSPTITAVRPTQRTQNAVDSSAQMGFSCDFVADDLSIATS